MDWKLIITDLHRELGGYQQIADQAGMSKGAVHDLGSGRAKSVMYETGCKLVDMHRRVMRKAARRVAK